MNIQELRQQLVNICEEYILTEKEMTTSAGDGSKVVIAEPYIPYIPKKWNGVLVLAEAQYLQEKTANGREFVRKMKECLDGDGRIARVYEGQTLFGDQSYLGIGPWDEGLLKLAVRAALRLIPEKCAVSNGILWSQVNSNGSSVNPEWSDHIFEKSIAVWREMLMALKPKAIVIAGRKAEWVVDAIYDKSYFGSWPAIYRLTHPSRRNVNRLKKPYNVQTDLLPRYPEVEEALKGFPELVNDEAAIYYACHSVSQCKPLKG